MSNYKFEVGDRVYLDPAALSKLPKRLLKHLPATYRSHIFTVARRNDVGRRNRYFIPGYDWQGGTGWVVEEWLAKWCGEGTLRFSIEIMPEQDDTMETLHDFQRQILDSLRVPADRLGKIDFTYTHEPAQKLDKKVG